jgi:hypothetical protein
MTRKEAVQYITILLGGSLVGVDSLLSGCRSADDKVLFPPEKIAYLDEIADTILPPTKTPGAKQAAVGSFMAIMVAECYGEKEQQVFLEGMDRINELCNKEFGNSFVELTPAQRHTLLVQLDKEQKDYTVSKTSEQPAHYFRMMKELTLLGYFTSEPGCTKAKRYVPVPGRFEGCIPYKKGDKAFA